MTHHLLGKPIQLGFVLTLLLGFASSTLGAEEATAAGCWSGCWRSCKTGHNGPMTAAIMPCGEDRYRAEFQGRFFKVFPFRYSVTLTVVERTDEAIILGGQSYLGRIFGTFYYTATVTENSFVASYRSRKDWGQFTMRR